MRCRRHPPATVTWAAPAHTGCPVCCEIRAIRRDTPASYSEPDVEPSLPPEEAWVEWRGHRWATNRHVLVREDVAVESAKWVLGLSAKNYDIIDDAASGVASALTRTDRTRGGDDNPDAVVYLSSDSDGREVHVQARYAPLLDGAEAKQSGPLDPIVCRRDGEIVAYVMPVRLP